MMLTRKSPRDGGCCELVAGGDGYEFCNAAMESGSLVRLSRSRDGSLLADLGRGMVRAGPYCAAHGGKARADREAHADWDHLAPSSVGDHQHVLDAGCLGLTSRDAYVVVRRLPDEVRPDLWRVHMTWDQRETILAKGGSPNVLRAIGLGCGTLMTPEERRARRAVDYAAGAWGVALDIRLRPGGIRQHARCWLAQLGVGSLLIDVSSHATEEAASDAGHAAWRARIDADVQRIRKARGGTLDWGTPVEPLADPIVLDPAPKESAWSVVGRTPRRAPRGLSLVSGVRASGEPA